MNLLEKCFDFLLKKIIKSYYLFCNVGKMVSYIEIFINIKKKIFR